MTDKNVPQRDPYLELLKGCLTASIYDESAWKVCDGFRANRSGLWYQFRRAAFRWLANRGYLLVQLKQFDAEKRAAGQDWPMFGYSMIGTARLNNLEACLRTIIAERIPGDILETGVWRGGACLFMKAMLDRFGEMSRTIWLADSFEGLPKPTTSVDKSAKNHDFADCDFLKVSLEQVQANFERFHLLDERVRFLKGWFCDTLPNAPIEKLALLRMDGDLYESTNDALHSMYHRVVPGGFVVVDDYSTWTGCRQAITEFRAKHQIDAELIPIDGSAVYWRVPQAQRNRAAA